MKDFIYDEMYKDEKNHWWFKARRKIVLSIVKSLIGGGDINII